MPGLNKAAIKCVIKGSMSGAQGWSTSVWVAATIDPLTLDLAQFAGAFQDLAAAWAGSVSNYWSTTTQYDGVECYEYPIGSTVATRQAADTPSAPIVGSHSVNLLPTFCSLVQTLRTATSGRSFRGRMYLPYTSDALETNGQAPANTCTTTATATRDLLQALQDADYSGDGITAQQPVVASFTKGVTTPITSVFVDSLVDVQHRREDKIGAAHSAVEFVVP